MSNTDPTLYLSAPVAEVEARRAATKLRNLLRINSEFSLVTGTIGLVAALPIASLFAVDQVWIIRALGAGLMGFAAVVFLVSGTKTSTLRTWGQIISLNDLGWVLGTLAVIAVGWMSSAGVLVMGLTGLVVFVLAIAQMRARSRLIALLVASEATSNESPPVEILEFTRSSSSSMVELWPIMTDHSLYGELALNLKAVQSITPDGPGFERACTDSLGRTWSETCTLWEGGRRFDIDVDISDYPYPLQVVQGSWRVDPGQQSASDIGMRFAIQPKPGLYGRLVVPSMHLTFTPILKRIAKGWQKTAIQPVETSTVAKVS